MTINRAIFENIANQAQNTDVLVDEAKTCQYLIMPFFQALGYNVFDSDIFVPQYTADWGASGGRTKADYAIKRNGKVVMIVEAKSYGEALSVGNERQLAHYFATTEAKVGILTDGAHYQLYSDLDKPNIMDSRPFYVLDIRHMDEQTYEDLYHLSIDGFDFDRLIQETRGRRRIKEVYEFLCKQADEEPNDAFVRAVMGIVEPNVRQTVLQVQQFSFVVQEAIRQMVRPEEPASEELPFVPEPEQKPPGQREQRLTFAFCVLESRLAGYEDKDIASNLAELEILGWNDVKIYMNCIKEFFEDNLYYKNTGIKSVGTDPQSLEENMKIVKGRIDALENPDRVIKIYQHMFSRLRSSVTVSESVK